MAVSRILIVRLGAMGDILHALPAAATLQATFPDARVFWAVHPKWRELLEGGGAAAKLIFVNRHSFSSLRRAFSTLRRCEFDFTLDFQGLIQSALIARIGGARVTYGFHRSLLREKLAALFYSRQVNTAAAHVIDRNLDLAAAAGAQRIPVACAVPPGRPEGTLPQGPFVLAAPFAGWMSKQWPLENYAAIAARLPVPLVLNGSPAQESALRDVPGAHVHISSISGLIHATRQAAAVVGVDSGPLHLAAALGCPGVAIFGPTDPARNGPYYPKIAVLRSPQAVTTYKRGTEIDAAMRDIAPAQVLAKIMEVL